jgi:predicted nucleic acid-binding protein
VVDASVAVQWFLRDEADLEAADRVLDDYRQGRTSLVAPNQIRYEVSSAIRNAVRMGRETPQTGRLAIVKLLALAIPVVDDDLLIEACYEHALRFDCSLYDGLTWRWPRSSAAPSSTRTAGSETRWA